MPWQLRLVSLLMLALLLGWTLSPPATSKGPTAGSNQHGQRFVSQSSIPNPNPVVHTAGGEWERHCEAFTLSDQQTNSEHPSSLKMCMASGSTQLPRPTHCSGD
ncbi:uncharacterized protein IWZ02DRAFT_431412 [Phyllosticta citriasiana]|uniref:uncharacterized protein n=1 Tax=Phyllosticta citriasiana TaxID=595635 RepID=UPI0030FD7ECD